MGLGRSASSILTKLSKVLWEKIPTYAFDFWVNWNVELGLIRPNRPLPCDLPILGTTNLQTLEFKVLFKLVDVFVIEVIWGGVSV